MPSPEAAPERGRLLDANVRRPPPPSPSRVWHLTDWGKRLIVSANWECSSSQRGAAAGNCSWIQTESSAGRRLFSQTLGHAFASIETPGRCGTVQLHPQNVTKCRSCRCIDHSMSAAGLPSAAAYYLEKLALCRLSRCVRPCGGRPTYFPRVLSWDDRTLALTTHNEGDALATDMYSKAPSFRYSDVELSAHRHGALPPAGQFACMRQQLRDAGVVHMDLGCKNLFLKGEVHAALLSRSCTHFENALLIGHISLCARIPTCTDGMLTLGDFDAALVDLPEQRRFPHPLVRPWGNPPRSDMPRFWQESHRCFRA